MTALSTLARMLDVRVDLAEDAMHSERAARAVLSRRSLFAASAAMVGGSVFSFAAPSQTLVVTFAPGSDMWIMAEAVASLCAMAHENLSIATGVPFSRDEVRRDVFAAFRDGLSECNVVMKVCDLGSVTPMG